MTSAQSGRISDDLGALLWRRYYEARVGGVPHVHLLADTLKSLLEQAGVPEPEDDAVFGPGGVWHGRTMKLERSEDSYAE